MTVIAKESGHWYTKTGEPAYTQPNKSKGGERPTTIKDAKKHGLLPSVTTIMSIIAKPGLEIWKQNQILHAAATLPKIEGESVDDWCKRVVADSQEQGRDARDKGTEIHGAIERYFLGFDYNLEYVKEVELVRSLLHDLGIKHVATEKSFANTDHGFAGKIDFVGEDSDGFPVIIDFKTTDFKDKKSKYHWPEMGCQLAAYSVGLRHHGVARLLNVFISRNLPEPKIDFYEWEDHEIFVAWEKFYHMLMLWKLEKGYLL